MLCIYVSKKMNVPVFFILFLIQFSAVLVKQIEIKCPPHCTCDYLMKFKRATCTNKSLAGIELNLPVQTEILDLSFNQISNFDDHIFLEQNLTALKLLNISHNKLGHIHWRAFEGLNQLKTVDFSYNAIQYLRSTWISHLSVLEELYLRANSFSKFDYGPIFVSNTLKILDLSQCKITYLGGDIFKGLPKLEVLNLSENYLIHIDVGTVEPLKNLSTLMVHNNTFSCDSDMTKLASYCIEREILFENPCRIKDSGSEKFQRIISIAKPENQKNLWIYDNDETVDVNMIDVSNNCSNISADKSLLRDIIDLSPVLSILIPFLYGIAIGMLIGCTVQIKGKGRKKFNNIYTNFDDDDDDTNLRTRRCSRSKGNTQEESESLQLREWKLSESTPVLNRKTHMNL